MMEGFKFLVFVIVGLLFYEVFLRVYFIDIIEYLKKGNWYE